jgi:beta-lactamase class A
MRQQSSLFVSSYSRRRSQERNTRLRLVIGIAVVFGISSALVQQISSQPSPTSSTDTGTSETGQSQRALQSVNGALSINNLAENLDLQKILATNNDIGIQIAGFALSNSQSVATATNLDDPNQPMVAASITKLITALYAFKQIESGNVTLQTEIGEFTLQDHLEQLVRYSNTETWDLLNDYFPLPDQEVFARQSLGLSSYSYPENTITATDAARLTAAAYVGNGISADNAALLRSYMQQTNEESLLPTAISKTTAIPSENIWHKAGTLEWYFHDSAVITDLDGTQYALTIMTDGNGYPDFERRTALFQAILQTLTIR